MLGKYRVSVRPVNLLIVISVPYFIRHLRIAKSECLASGRLSTRAEVPSWLVRTPSVH